MKVSQLLAWILLAALAFFAVTLSIYSSYNVALLQKNIAELRQTADSNAALLREVRDTLERVESDLHPGPSQAPAEAE